MDYNSDENHRSNKLISATKGWANSLGHKVNVNQIIKLQQELLIITEVN